MDNDLVVRRSGELSGKVVAPGSKSVTHRGLVIASLASGVSVLENALACSDTVSTINGLKALGIKIESDAGGFEVEGRGGEFSVPAKPLDLGNSGTSLRFITTLAGFVPGRCVLTGDGSLRSRPMSELLKCLGELGIRTISLGNGGTAPIMVEGIGKIPGGRTTISGTISSQFISSLLMPAPYFERGLRLGIKGEMKSRPYVGLTIRVMKDFGVDVRVEEEAFDVVLAHFSHRKYQVDGDYSSSSFIMLAAAITNSCIRVTGLRKDSAQADEVFPSILQSMGCGVRRRGDMITIEGGELSGIDINLSDSPDLLPPVAVLASLADGPTTIRGVEHARFKESDRIAAICKELGRLGIGVSQRPDGLVFRGGDSPKGREVSSHGDHRIAMALAVLGTVTDGLLIRDASCIAVSYPNFVRDMVGVGVKVVSQ